VATEAVGVSRPVALAWLEQAGGERRYVESETRIGRGEQNNIRLDDPSVSRNHAIIRRVDGRYLISDLGSANSTFVNDQQVYVTRPLDSGDRIRVANTEFTFHLDALSYPGAEPTPHAALGQSLSQFFTTSGELDVRNYVDGDLRVVTVLFLDLHGFTALSEKVSPEQITAIINQCFEQLTQVAAHFGGYVDKYVGDGMMVLFGAPQAHADDAERAIRAALAMQATLGAFSQRLQRRAGIALEMRVGINTGEVLAGRVGSGQFSAFTVMGDSVNVASRLEGAARVGRILVGHTTWTLTRDVVRYAALPPVELRGKRKPARVYEVDGLPEEGWLVEADPSTPFVGREDQLRRLAELLAASSTGCRSVSISAEAGLGKSRLLTEFHRRHAHAARWARIRCAEYEQQTPYAVVRALARAVAGGAELSVPARGPDSVAQRQRLMEAFGQLLRESALDHGLVLILDSVEWADPHSLATLEHAATTLKDVRILLLRAAQPGGDPPWNCDDQPLCLQPLADDACARLIRLLLHTDDIDPQAIEILVRRSAGVPLALVELVNASLDSGRLRQVETGWCLDGDATVGGALALRGMVQASLDRLVPKARQVLRLATVLDQDWSIGLLAEALDEHPPPADVLRQLLDLGFLSQIQRGDEPTYELRQPFVKAVIDASLPELERRRLHERAALAIERSAGHQDAATLKRIAQHFSRAGRTGRAVEYLMRHADAAGVAAPGEYRAALQEAERITDARERAHMVVDLQERLGDLLLRQADLAEAQIAFESACDLSASEQRRADLRCKLAAVAVRRGNHQRVLELWAATASQTDLALSTWARSEALAALSLVAQGEVQHAGQRADRAITLATEAADASARGLALYAQACVWYLDGRLVDSFSAMQQSATDRREAGDGAGWVESQIMLGLIGEALGDVAPALEAVRGALAGIGPAGDPWLLARGATVFGRLLVGHGQAARGARHLSRAMRVAERIGAHELALEARIELARAVLDQASPGAAEASFKELRSAIRAAAVLQLYPLVCRARVVLSAALGKFRPAEDARARRKAEIEGEEALELARRLGLKLYESLAQDALLVARAAPS
jgi:class 3 adenylate cyclase/tetratricopeptide (TPR) repeat protein